LHWAVFLSLLLKGTVASHRALVTACNTNIRKRDYNMFDQTEELDAVSHPLIESAYLKCDYRGNILVIETNFTHQKKKVQMETLLTDLHGLIDRVENNVIRLDMIDIRMRQMRK
jgi:hypothetical protein